MKKHNVDIRTMDNTMVVLPSHYRGYELSEKDMMKSILLTLLSEGISKEQLNSFYNALSLAQRLFPEGGQISCGDYLITYGDEIETNVPNWNYDDLAYMEELMKIDYEEFNEDELSFEEFAAGWDPFEFYFDDVIEYFKEYLHCYFGDDNIIYKTDGDEIIVIDLQDDESILEAVRLFNYETTRGYCYTNDFEFKSSNVIATYSSDWQKPDNQDYLELLQKMCALDIEYSGYDWNALYGVSGYTASIVQDYYWTGRAEFFKLYFDEYGYVDALTLDLNDIDADTYDLSYILACQMLEIRTEKCKEIEDYQLWRLNKNHLPA